MKNVEIEQSGSQSTKHGRAYGYARNIENCRQMRKGGTSYMVSLTNAWFQEKCEKTKQLSLRQQRYAPKHEDD